MMKGIAFCIFLFLGLQLPAMAQNVKSTTFAQLKERFENGKDTVYIVNFWATWCAPCIKEMPYFNKLQQSYSHNPVKVIFLSLDFASQQKQLSSFLASKNFVSETFMISRRNDQELIEEVSTEWEGAIPATLFVNKSRQLWRFYQKEFNYEDLEKTYQSLK